MNSLHILWQRLVTAEGKTCDRCHGTQDAIEQAVPKLQEALRPLRMDVTLERRVIAPDAFKDSPAESNRIWINGRPIDDWLGGTVGNSTCGSACHGEGCRTLTIGDETFETVPEELIVKAALLAASQSIGRAAPDDTCKPHCGAELPVESSSCCSGDDRLLN